MKILYTLYVMMLALFNNFKAKIKGYWQYAVFSIGVMQTSIDLSGVVDIIVAFLPVIILFAVLGMILGLLKKFGRF
ncbi:MAG: hypothetical protein QW228_08000 [Candidatus Aenigmatarchaeota archaeon]